MTDQRDNLLKQVHLNVTFSLIMDGSVEEIVAELRADKTPEMQIEIMLLRQIYEKFLEAKPIIQRLQDRGKQIVHSKAN